MASFLPVIPLFVVLVAGGVVAATSVQRVPSAEQIALGLWEKGKGVTQIPWSLSVPEPTLRRDLRREININATVLAGNLEESGANHDLILLARVLDEKGQPIAGNAVRPNTPERPEIARNPRARITFPLLALVRPGKYRLELALIDQATGRASTRFQTVSVDGDLRQPLEQLLSDHPRFEFVPRTPPVPAELRRPAAAGLIIPPMGARIPGDLILRPTSLFANELGFSSYAAPLFTIDAPTRISIVTLLSPPERHSADAHRVEFLRANITNVLSVLTRLDPAQGSARFTGLNLITRKRIFDDINLRDASIELLAPSLEFDTTTVTLDAIAGQDQAGPFLREVLQEQLDAAERDTALTNHVFILLGPRTAFRNHADLGPLQLSGNCRCRIFYLRFALAPNETDHLPKLLRPYKPKIFEPLTWGEFRDDFEELYVELLRGGA